MIIVRPVEIDDLDQLFELSKRTTFGLTSLPSDRGLLAKRIEESLAGFKASSDRPAGETYLFVAEDQTSGQLAGTCGMVSKVGGFEPFYAYRIETTVHTSKMLKIRKEVQALHLVEEHDGPCEIGSLFVSPDVRGKGLGRFLSLVRFLFMADFKERFDPHVIAELRGVIDEQGRSAFWDALGRHFFDLDFPKADHLSLVNKAFIGDLMPRHPIYVPLLPADAQAVIGQVHVNTRPALAILQAEGFKQEMVDIFEAGPIMHCPLKDIRSVRQSIRNRVAEIVDQKELDASSLNHSTRMMISNAQRTFRACTATIQVLSNGFRLSTDVADALRVRVDDPVRVVALKPDHSRSG